MNPTHMSKTTSCPVVISYLHLFMHLSKFYTILVLALLVSCKKKELQEPDNTPVDFFSNGVLVLNEGLFQQNNASLSWINFSNSSVNNEVFEQKTNRQLGDTGNDIIQYGNKIYVVVSVSSTIEVLDASSGASLKQISMEEGGIAKQPRFAAKANGKIFVTCFDGFVDIIDTINLAVVHRIPVGANPDEIHAVNNKLYIANSGGINYPNVDSTLSIIDPIAWSETARIVVGKNPTRVTSDAQGNLYVITQTGSNSLTNRLVKVNATTNQVDTIYNWNVMRMTPMNHYLILNILQGNTSTIQLFDTQTGTIANSNFISGSLFNTYYGAQYNAATNQLYCFDAMNYVNGGYVRIFSPNGTAIKSIQVGLNPSKLLFYE